MENISSLLPLNSLQSLWQDFIVVVAVFMLHIKVCAVQFGLCSCKQKYIISAMFAASCFCCCCWILRIVVVYMTQLEGTSRQRTSHQMMWRQEKPTANEGERITLVVVAIVTLAFDSIFLSFFWLLWATSNECPVTHSLANNKSSRHSIGLLCNKKKTAKKNNQIHNGKIQRWRENRLTWLVRGWMHARLTAGLLVDSLISRLLGCLLPFFAVLLGLVLTVALVFVGGSWLVFKCWCVYIFPISGLSCCWTCRTLLLCDI